ncbi:ketoacyl-synt-domain-containing protein [Cylindrobasidium torrendii FP15055 ss-10]|uniref:Ketoacyl-synt-domain-containing protein n=1 Tax=Cylindrobasidium torrendii FP15055 ss-10 TaxID=1314674 RepID=A0A0D7BIM5_9AGAR|nr:ketoacyl-synt-domain-containing protein [Cylindrobasidium torrendii FP15055 ss-10]
MTSMLNIPLFTGQGSAPEKFAAACEIALDDATRPEGSYFLAACHDAFHAELKTLPPGAVSIDLHDFGTKDKLVIPGDRYLFNAVTSGSSLFIIQILRYMVFVDSLGSRTANNDVLGTNAHHGVGVLGFSSGILPATVVSSSSSRAEFMKHAIEVYRLVLWIGIRAQQYRQDAMKGSFIEPSATWSVMLQGRSVDDIELSVHDFKVKRHGLDLFVTAVIDTTCVTVSGRPDTLSTFVKGLHTSAHDVPLSTLYHAPVHHGGVRAAVLDDISRRGIKFPAFADLRVPLRSSSTGDVITVASSGRPLVELVVDMVLVNPVRWDAVVNSVAEIDLPFPVRLLNVGPGSALAKSLAKKLNLDVDLSDLSSSTFFRRSKHEPIAIVGMAVDMPGAPNISKLWEVLEKGLNTVSEIPESRFSVADYQDGKRQMRARTGNFIENAAYFDNKFFKISPREARSMDPQQRILLHTAYEALEDAGYVPNSTPSFNQDTFGCYIGEATNDYVQNLRNDIDVYYSTGTLKAFLSGRLSYAMQLGGPSVVVDTACSSSGVAVYQACRALADGDCNAALVGGVNIITSPDMFLGLDRGHFLSPSGQCKSFDASADGYSRSEGCGVFVLKRLSDALAEQDRIWGVIRAVNVNQSGRASSITHPHVPTQVKLFESVLDHAGMTPDMVSVVEAHGTGTQAGDPGELESIGEVFLSSSREDQLHVGSVKANIGHLEAASGAAGLAKLLLMFQHKSIPACVSLKVINPKITPTSGFVFDKVSTPWASVKTGQNRIALLNNFGAAGSNSAILLEEFPLSSPPAGPDVPVVFGLSAKTDDALLRLRDRYVEWLQSDSNKESWVNVAYTATSRRRLYPHRISIVASNKMEAAIKLKSLGGIETRESPRIGFVFSGQGTQYPGMGRQLYETYTTFRSDIDECHTLLVDAGFSGVLQTVLAQEGMSGHSTHEELETNQVVIFVVEYALSRLWRSWGISPEVVAGQSLGEYAALVVAGVLSLRGALKLVAHRARLMFTLCARGSTGMLAVNVPASSLESHLAKFTSISVACLNSPADCVLSGPTDALQEFKQYLTNTVACKSALLDVPFGYHSPAMDPILDDLTSIAYSVEMREPNIPIVSNATGCVVRPGDGSVFTPHYFARHCRQTVRFEAGVASLLQDERIDVWIEIGPHTNTLSMLKTIAGINVPTLLPSMKKQHNPCITLAASLSALYITGALVDWRCVFGHLPQALCVSLPSYPFSPTRFWVDFVEDTVAGPSLADAPPGGPSGIKYSLLGRWTQQPTDANDNTTIFETPISQLADRIAGHRVATTPLCPASVYLEHIFSGIATSWPYFADCRVALKNVAFLHPLVYDPSVHKLVITSIVLIDQGGSFTISSRIDGHTDSVHTRGEFKIKPPGCVESKFQLASSTVHRNISAVAHPSAQQEKFSTRTIYENLFLRVVEYSQSYQTIQTLTLDSERMEATARICVPPSAGISVVDPVFLDTLLHVPGFMANFQGRGNDVFICTEVGSVKLLVELIDPRNEYTVYCNGVWVDDRAAILANAWAREDGTNRVVAAMEGMQFRKLRLDTFSKLLAKPSGAPASAIPKSVRPDLSRMRTTSSAMTWNSAFSTRGTCTPSADQLILEIFAEGCGISLSSVTPHMELEALGVDSMMSIEITSRIRAALPQSRIDSDVFSQCRTIEDVIREVYSLGTAYLSGDALSTNTLVVEQEPPIELHTDNSIASIKHALASVLDVNPLDITDSTELGQLGLDSMTSIEALHVLKVQFNLDLPSDFFATHTSLVTIQDYLHRVGRKEVADAPDFVRVLRLDQFPSVLQEGGEGLPLFVFHDGSGLVKYYSRVGPVGRPVYGIHNPRFLTPESWKSVEEMAKEYARVIAEITSGPVLLGGWSFGGVAAYETAMQLTHYGVNVKGLILIDAPNPEDHTPLSMSLISAAVNSSRHNNLHIEGLVQDQFAKNSALLEGYKPAYPHGKLSTVYLRASEGFNPEGVEEVPKWLADRSCQETGWERIAEQGLRVVDIPGNHFEVFRPSNIPILSSKISEACAYLQDL